MAVYYLSILIMEHTMQNSDEIKTALERMGSEAKAAARKLATATTGEKNNWLNAMADAIDANTAFILA